MAGAGAQDGQHAASLPKQVSAAELRACLHVSAAHRTPRSLVPTTHARPLPRPRVRGGEVAPSAAGSSRFPARSCVGLGAAMWVQPRLTRARAAATTTAARQGRCQEAGDMLDEPQEDMQAAGHCAVALSAPQDDRSGTKDCCRIRRSHARSTSPWGETRSRLPLNAFHERAQTVWLAGAVHLLGDPWLRICRDQHGY